MAAQSLGMAAQSLGMVGPTLLAGVGRQAPVCLEGTGRRDERRLYEEYLRELLDTELRTRHDRAATRRLREARDARTLGRLHQRLLRTSLLIVDELGFVPFDRSGGELLFNLLSERHERRSTLVGRLRRRHCSSKGIAQLREYFLATIAPLNYMVRKYRNNTLIILAINKL